MHQHRLSSRQRLTRLFEGKDIDRIPFWLLFNKYQSHTYAGCFDSSYKHVLKRIYEHSEFIERMTFDTGFCYTSYPGVNTKKSEYFENGYNVAETSITYKDIKLTKKTKHGIDSVSVDNFVTDVRGLDTVLRLPYREPLLDLSRFIAEKERLGNGGLMGVELADPISVLHDLCDETHFVLLAYEETEKVIKFLDAISERILAVHKNLLESGVADFFWIRGAEFVVPPMLPPSLFDKLAGKYIKKICDLIRSYGKLSFLHCHGKTKLVLDSLNKIGMDAVHPVEAPPMGDCTLTMAREAFGKNVVLFGNIQYGDLWTKNEAEMEDVVNAAIDEGQKCGRFVLSTTTGPSAAKINFTVARNYLKIIDTVLGRRL